MTRTPDALARAIVSRALRAGFLRAALEIGHPATGTSAPALAAGTVDRTAPSSRG